MTFLPLALVLADAGLQHMSAVPMTDRIVLDGKLDEPAWRAAPPDERFTQKMPDGGKPPVEKTTVRVLYDKEFLYVGVDCTQETAPVVARLTRRDHPIEADSVTVIFGTRGDGKSAFEFSVNAAGVLSDGIHFNDTDMNTDWDENWEAVTAITKRGWSAEFKIPLRILRFPSVAEQSWGFEVRRYVSHRQETDEWAFIPRDMGGEVSRYGHLDGLKGLSQKTSVELRPFVVATVRHLDPQGRIPGTDYDFFTGRGFQFTPSAGLDLKWHVTQALTLDATFNPDFGQVEQDQVVLNLTTFETFYPEKRPFFLEGIDTFSLPLPLLYTRRIGLAPELPVLRSGAPFFEHQVDSTATVPIYMAAKLSGDLGGGWSTSELLALTAKESSEVNVNGAPAVDRLAQPITAFKLFRLKKDLGSDAYVGGVVMATNRLEPGGEPYPALPGTPDYPTTELCPDGNTAAPNQRCFHDSYVAGLDAKWRPGGGDWVGTAQVVNTLIENGPPRLQPDGVVISSGDLAPVAYVNVNKDGGKHLIGGVVYDFHGLKADYNDLGYMQRQNQHHVDANVEWRTLEPWASTNETHTWIEFFDRYNLAGLPLGRGIQLGSYIKYKNFWSSYGLLRASWTYDDDREVGDGTALERLANFGFEASVASDTRKIVHGSIWQQTLFNENGVLHQGQADVAVNVLPQWDVEAIPTWYFTWGEPRYAGSQDEIYLFGKQRGENVAMTLRSTYTFTPRLTLQAYGQLFLAAVHYSDITSYPAMCLDPTQPCLDGDTASTHVVHLSDLRPFTGFVLNSPDYVEATFNANVVLRWEYKLGSTIYVVYSHGQDNTVSTVYSTNPAYLNFQLLKPRAADDAFAVKVSYFWQ
ncbi:MAG TPA: DUF5916 domain-containing protein [Byssovorax sp.]